MRENDTYYRGIITLEDGEKIEVCNRDDRHGAEARVRQCFYENATGRVKRGALYESHWLPDKGDWSEERVCYWIGYPDHTGQVDEGWPGMEYDNSPHVDQVLDAALYSHITRED